MGSLAENLELKLESKGIHTLRQIGRVVGVSNPTTKKKDELVRDIMAIAKNLAEPCPRSTRGAPPKTEEYDRELVDEIERLRQDTDAILKMSGAAKDCAPLDAADIIYYHIINNMEG